MLLVTIGTVVASKFYDPQTEKVSQSLVEKYVQMLKKSETFQKGRFPVTENQK